MYGATSHLQDMELADMELAAPVPLDIEPSSTDSATEDRTRPTAGPRASRFLVALVVILGIAVLALSVVVLTRFAAMSQEAKTGPGLRAAVLQREVRERPDDVELRRSLAHAYQAAGRDREALREYEVVLANNSQDVDALYNAGMAQLNLEQWRGGIRRLGEVLALEPTHAMAAVVLGRRYASAGEFGRLAKTVVPAAAAHPDLADLQYLAGLGYEKSRNSRQAAAYYRKALRLVPGMTEAKRGLQRVEGAQ